ncbi:hypothetical protein M9H77_15372 [Catharanthus roseus]|uniref:Uncharacterized protein n=1 Tax=Catharanthus roseus TaxID=4058 RepID=A0ACC0AZE9_CATRO|nr:hypothetical protein M9H77_15372 [Catharanthus roseus]
MATNKDTSELKTLADAVTETAAVENVTETETPDSGPNVNRVRVSNLSSGDLDGNAAFDGGGSVLVTRRVIHTETVVVEAKMVGPDEPDSGSGESNGNGNGVSLSFACEGEKKCGYQDVEESGYENKSGSDKMSVEVNGSVPDEAQMDDDGQGGNRGIENLNHDGSANNTEMDGQEGSDDGEFVEAHGYSVGDLVWGKIKSHPWWPGQIYDPSDASESAVKYNHNRKGRLLVAYFGDRSFAWCLPSQLIPFAQHFEEMSKQSSLKSFVNAVQEAVDEIGRLVDLEMTCQCVPEENRKGLTRPTAVNAGIKEGVLVPNGDIGKLLSFRYDTAELLATVENAAESLSFASMLELAILKSWLSAFYRARGGYTLPEYGRPLEIEGLEDKNRNGSAEPNDFSVPIEVPIHRPVEEDWLSSAAAVPGNGQAPQQDKMHHRRKQKSVAELLAEDTGAKFNTRKRSSTSEGRGSSSSAIKKQKLKDEVENHSGSVQAASNRKRGRKKNDDISQSGEPTASDAPSGFQTEVQMQEKSLSSKLGKERIKIPDGNNGEGIKTDEMSSPRERKKSKYLSPPYTTPGFRAGNLSSKKEELEKGTEKVTESARMGERITKAAGKLLELSPPLERCDRKTAKKKSSEEQVDIASNLNSQTGNEDQQKSLFTMDGSTSVNEMFSGLKSFAVNPLHCWKGEVFELVEGFVSTFRSFIFVNGANYKEYHKKRHGRKRKSLNSGPLKSVDNLNQTGEKPKAAQRSDKKSKQGKLNTDTPKAKTSSKKSKQEKSNTDTPKRKTSSKKSKQEKSNTDTPKAKTSSKKSKQEKSNTDTPKAKTSSKKSIIEKSETPKSKKAAAGGSGKKADSRKEVDRKPHPASLLVEFTRGFSLPSRDDIIRTFMKFGDINEQETGVFPDSSSIRISYKRSSDAEEALRASLKQNPFGFRVNYKLCYYPSAAPVPVNETTDVGSMTEKLQTMTSLLQEFDDKISSVAKSNIEADIKLLFDKVKMIVEAASK